jgi:hypothetical protein
MEDAVIDVPTARKFKLRIVPPKRANEPYSDSEVELILSKVPTRRNVVLLARSLERTRAAITTIFQMAYSGKWLKQTIEDNAGCPGRNNVHLRIAEAKARMEIVVGHQPKLRAVAPVA